MAISISGVNAPVQAAPVTARAAKAAPGGSPNPTTAALNQPAHVAAIQSKPGQLDSPAQKTARPLQNQLKTDTVEVSPQAKARMLRDTGRPVFEIAVILNLDIKTVKSYLGAAAETSISAREALQDNHSPPASQQPSNPAEAYSGTGAEKRQGTLQAQADNSLAQSANKTDNVL